MTDILGEPRPGLRIPARQVPGALTDSWWTGLGAAFNAAGLEADTNFRWARERDRTRAELMGETMELLGFDTVREIYEFHFHGHPAPDSFEAAWVARWAAQFPGFPEALIAAAGAARLGNPEAWKDWDFSEEAVRVRTQERLRAEWDEEQSILSMMPRRAGAARFLGAVGAEAVDWKTIPTFFMSGGGGGLLKIFGRAALANMSLEAAFLPDRYQAAEDLDIPDPDVLLNLSVAGLTGGVLSAAPPALVRGVRYWHGRNTPPGVAPAVSPPAGATVPPTAVPPAGATVPPTAVPPAGATVPPTAVPPARLSDGVYDAVDTARADPIRDTLIVDRVESILVNGGTVGEAFGAARRASPPDDPPAPAPAPIAQSDVDATVRSVEEAITEARNRDTRSARPLAQALRATSGTRDAGFGIDPNGPVGRKLKASGITARAMPGLFSRRGRKDVDNLPASEWEDRFPGIRDATGTAPDDLYLNRNGVLDVLTRELAGGDDTWLPSRREAADLRTELDAWAASRNAPETLARPDPARTGGETPGDALAGPPPPGEALAGPPPPGEALAGGSATREAFGDPASPESVAFQDAVIADLRGELQDGVPAGESAGIDMGDGKGSRSTRDVLDELDADQEFLEAMEACSKGGRIS